MAQSTAIGLVSFIVLFFVVFVQRKRRRCTYRWRKNGRWRKFRVPRFRSKCNPRKRKAAQPCDSSPDAKRTRSSTPGYWDVDSDTGMDMDTAEDYNHDLEGISGGGEDGDVIILSSTMTTSLKFKEKTRVIQFKLKSLKGNVEIRMFKALEQMIEKIYDEAESERARFGFIFNHPALNSPIYVPFNVRAINTPNVIMRRLQKQTQSAGSTVFDQQMTIRATILSKGQAANALTRESRGVIPINNTNDKYCLARAIVVAMAYAEAYAHAGVKKDPRNTEKKEEERKLYCAKHQIAVRLQKHDKQQEEKAIALLQDARVSLNLSSYGIPELEKIQRSLPHHRLYLLNPRKIDDGGKNFDPVLWKSPNQRSGKPAFIINIEGDHYDAVTTVELLRGLNFCPVCSRCYNTATKHCCNTGCTRCLCTVDDGNRGGTVCDDVTGNRYPCGGCNLIFTSRTCFDTHLTTPAGNRTRTICDGRKFCSSCEQVYKLRNAADSHACLDTVFCELCMENVNEDFHDCFMKAPSEETIEKLRSNSSKWKKIYFDVETTECDQCTDKPLNEECRKCGHRTRQYKYALNEDVEACHGRLMKEFLSYLLTQQQKGAVVIAHNGGSYDFLFVLEELLKTVDTTNVNVISNGNKILQMDVKVNKLRFVDSINFLYAPLAKLPKIFGLRDESVEISKGYFPYYENVPDNYGKWIDRKPAKAAYGYENMSKSRREQFDAWYATEEFRPWHFDLDLVKYCEADVTILRKSCQAFSHLFMGISDGLDPFVMACTIAGACSQYFFVKHFRPDTIAHCPELGVFEGIPQSTLAIKYLEWLKESTGADIQHKMNRGEKRIRTQNHVYRADGFVEAEQRIIEVNGCFWHGCPKCFNANDFIYDDKQLKALGGIANIPYGMTMGDRYTRTLAREQELKDQRYQVTAVWECDILKELAENAEMEEFFKKHDGGGPGFLIPRQAFFGGRTGVCDSLHETDLTAPLERQENLYYYDVTSLYPHINKTGTYPVGSPHIQRSGFPTTDLLTPEYVRDTMKGLIMAEVEAPKGLLHPVLPFKKTDGGNLQFGLCRTCAFGKNQMSECTCSQEDRRIHGTWTHLELAKALEKGYRIHRVIEVWRWPEDLFKGYITEFLKIKQEASGWPSSNMTSDEKSTYIAQCQERMGFLMDAVNIVKNEGMRSSRKLMLNSFWGKFGQRGNLPSSQFVHSPEEIWTIIENDRLELLSCTRVTDDIYMTSYRKKSEYECAYRKGSLPLPVAIFTTSQARLQLYEYLEELGERVVYYDTDSVIFRATDTENQALLVNHKGDFLGQLKDETEGDPIVKFVACGPKAYAYITWSGKVEVKIRGITLDAPASEILHYATLKAEVQKHLELYRIREDGSRLIDQQPDDAGEEGATAADDDDDDDELIVCRPQFARKDKRKVRTRLLRKRFRMVNKKGVYLRNLSRLYPFGF